MVSKQRFKPKVAVYLLLKQQDKILFARRANTGYMDGYYSLAAGHIDGNENLKTAMIREAKEEIGIEIEAKNLSLVHVMHCKSEIDGTTDDEYIDFYFEASEFNLEPKICEPEKCDNLTWFYPDKLPGRVAPKVKQAVQAIVEGQVYGEYNW